MVCIYLSIDRDMCTWKYKSEGSFSLKVICIELLKKSNVIWLYKHIFFIFLFSSPLLLNHSIFPSLIYLSINIYIYIYIYIKHIHDRYLWMLMQLYMDNIIGKMIFKISVLIRRIYFHGVSSDFLLIICCCSSKVDLSLGRTWLPTFLPALFPFLFFINFSFIFYFSFLRAPFFIGH